MMVFHNEDGNPARANIKQALGSYERPHKGVKASANSDIMYFFTSAQDGDPLQDNVRLCLGDDLKKAQDHNSVMSSASTVTYTSVYTDSEPGRVFWGADEELSDGGSPRVIVYGYDGLPMQPVAKSHTILNGQ
ncbi:hypothetical protein Tco_0723662 [Tanacetum coccineum]